MSDLPSWLLDAVERHLEGRSRAELSESSGRISRAYRAGRASRGVVRGEGDALAYAVARMPATFAAASRVLSEVEALLPAFAPVSLLDAGAGPGTAGFAAAGIWPGIERLMQIDHNGAFLALAKGFAEAGGAEASFELRQKTVELDRLPSDLGQFDLVILGYVLAEFDEEGAADLAETLWRCSRSALVVVEPGTPDGYRRVIQARRRLIAAGARILAPCPHQAECPLSPPDWCHFSERLPRRRAHMAAKGASLPFEDERYSYLVAIRDPVPRGARQPRIIAPPDASKSGIRLKLCRTDATSASETVARRDRARFAEARRLDWGDRFEPSPTACGENDLDAL